MSLQVYTFSPEGYFDIGLNELELFRNGKKQIVGLEYIELTQTKIQFLDTINSGDLIEAQVRGRQLDGHPGLYNFYIEGSAILAGDNILVTVPVYTPGNNSMRVYRNGKLLSLSVGDYTELADTVVQVSGPLTAGDQFEFIVRGENEDGEPLLFEEFSATGGTNEVFTLAGTFLDGTDTLEVFRNGKKLVNVFGYDELTSSTIRYNGVSTAGDLFTFIVRAQSPVLSIVTC